MMKLFARLLGSKKDTGGGGREIKITLSTHNGAVLDTNEDNFFINGKTRPVEENVMNVQETSDGRSMLLGVCDGMGGEVMGEIASDIAARMSAQLYERLESAAVEDFLNEVNDYANAANSEICRSLENDDLRRGGSTLALAYIRDDTVYAFSLGDSRIYLFRDGELTRITEDHTLAMRKYQAGIYTLEEAEQSMDSHKLTLFLGVDVSGSGLAAQWYQPFQLTEGAKLLLCSDGLYDMCSKEEIKNILSAPSEDHALTLVNKAIEKGGRDNITCMVAEFVRGGEEC